MRALLAVVAVVSLALPAAAGADTTIASLGRPTEVSSDAGVLAVSRWDGSAFRLAVSDGGPLRDMPIAPRLAPFQADVGTDSRGRRELIYVRCAVDGAIAEQRGCGLVVYPLPGGPEQRVTTVDAPAAQAAHPTLGRGRVAWVRTYASGRQAVYERNLRDRRTKRSVRLDGAAPARTCVTISERCVPVRHLGFDALQLTDGRLAAVSHFGSSSPVGISQSELRLVDVFNGGPSRRVAFQVSGLGGQAIIGPSFARGRLGWALSCTGEPDGCTTRKAGYWRYTIGAGYEQAAARPRLFGFALQGDGSAIELQEGPEIGCQTFQPGRPDPGCALVRTAPLAFAPAPAPF